MRFGKQSFKLEKPAYIRAGYTIVGDKEGDGNFGDFFDMVLRDDLWGEKSYEKAECKMHREAISGAICKAGLRREDVDYMLAGDLLNEISASSLAAREFPVPFIGLFNACSTFSESLLLGSILLEAGLADIVACSTSSHFSSAERQYRYPLELGNQRTPTAQWTVTGAGCTILTSDRPRFFEIERKRREFNQKIVDGGTEREEDRKAEEKEKSTPSEQQIPCADTARIDGTEKNYSVCAAEYGERAEAGGGHYERTHVAKITGGTFGRVIDLGIDDESNMGAAMAPAAAHTLLTHFRETGTSPSDYDAIFTGDLGRFGKETLEYLLSTEGIALPATYTDCGASYFKPEQKTFQGGSGAGCVNTVFNAYILKMLENGTLKKVLVAPTGALLNKDTPLQKETIPGISHAFVVETELL